MSLNTTFHGVNYAGMKIKNPVLKNPVPNLTELILVNDFGTFLKAKSNQQTFYALNKELLQTVFSLLVLMWF